MRLSSIRSVGIAALALTMLVSFQNCSQQKDNLHVSSSSSVQCRAQMKADVAKEKIPAAQLRCGDFNNYACERRIFSPNVGDLQHSLKECAVGGAPCVDVEVREFNTSGLQSASSPEQFAPGGDYNHEEIHCYHRMLMKGLVVFEGSGDSLEESLAGAMAACEKSQEGT